MRASPIGFCVASLSIVATVLGCDNPTLPTHHLGLEIEADTVWISRSPNEVRITVPVLIRNQDDRPLYVTPCGHVLQVASGDRWTTVWSSPCTLGRLYSLELEPGKSTLLSLGTRVPIASANWPTNASPGTYRAVLSLTATPLNTGGIPPTSLAAESRTTRPFLVRVRTVVF